MRLRSFARRAGVPVPFLALSFLVLFRFSGPATVISHPSDRVSVPFVIVTTPDLEPAFRALESWNQEQGCEAAVVCLPAGTLPKQAEDLVTRVGAICSRHGTVGLVLGGDRSAVPGLAGAVETVPAEFYDCFLAGVVDGTSSPPRFRREAVPSQPLFPSGLKVGRVPVETPTEAWAFVDACRSSGLTLSRLLEPDRGQPAGTGHGASPVLAAWASLPGRTVSLPAAPTR